MIANCPFPSVTTPQPWRASWIGALEAGRDQPNSWACFRRSFDLTEHPEVALARIAVDSKYWLWVNGRIAVREGSLKRGPNPRDTYFDTVDLAPYLRPGENTIAVLTWYWGKDGFSHKSSGQAGLLFELPSGETLVTSDTSWRARTHPAFGPTQGEQPNWRLPEANIRFDARADIAGWTEPSYYDEGWPRAAELAPAGAAPWNDLVPRPIPQWKDYGLGEYADTYCSMSDGEPLTLRLPYNAQFTPYLHVDAPAGLTIGVQTGNYRCGGEANVRAEYVTRAGVQEFESPGWMNGQEAIYTIPAGVKILGLKFRESGYDTEFTGQFRCDDPFFNALWEKSRRTLYITMRDSYMDCPDRERAQWWGDAAIELGEAFYALSPSSTALAQKAIRELCAWQRPDHTLYSPVPAGNWEHELPQQSLASIGHFGFWTYYLYSGDRQTVIDAYPHIAAYLSLWHTDENGLVIHRAGGWDWADWGENIDVRVLDQAWYCLALRAGIEMARLAGRKEDVADYQERMQAVAEATNAVMWNGEAYRSPDYQDLTDERGQALCVLAGIAPASRYPAIKKILTTVSHASPYLEKYVLEALLVMGEPDAALVRIRRRYAGCVESPWTTLPELWNPELGGTCNHAWSGGPLTLISQYVAGILPLEPGFKTFQVRPRMGSLRRIEAVVDSTAGKIDVTLNRGAGKFNLTVTVPTGTSARVCVPEFAKTTEVLVNASTVWPAAKSPIQGIDFEGGSGECLNFLAGPGEWEFTAIGNFGS